jgi:hypothetical protein
MSYLQQDIPGVIFLCELYLVFYSSLTLSPVFDSSS